MLHLWPQPVLLLKKRQISWTPFATFQSPFSTHSHRLSTGDEKNVRWHQQKSHLTTRTLFELSGNPAAGLITNRCTIDQPLSAMLRLLYGAMIIPKRHCIRIYLLQSGHWRCSSCECTRGLWLTKILKMQSAHPPPHIVMPCLLLLLCPIAALKAMQNIACTLTVRTISWLVR